MHKFVYLIGLFYISELLAINQSRRIYNFFSKNKM